MPRRARAVVIGGGVGGASIALPPRRARLDRRRAASSSTADARLDLALGRPRRPAALVAQPDPDDAVLGRALRRARPRETGKDPGWHELGGLRLASSPERVEEIQRQAAGQDLRPGDRDRLRRGGAGAVPADVDRRRARRRVPARRRLPRPEPADVRAGRRARGGAAPTSSTGMRVTGFELERGRVARRGHRRRATIETEVVVIAGGMYAPRDRRGWSGVDVPDHPVRRTSTSSPSRSTRRCRRCRRCATPTASSTSAPRSAAWSWAATSATRPPGRSTASRTASRRSCSPEDRERFEESLTNADRARAGPGDREGQEALQRPRGVHARRRVHPRRVRGARASGSPPASAPTAWRAPAASAGDGRVDRRRPARVDLWHMDIRRFGAHYAASAYTLARTSRPTRSTTTSCTRATSASRRGRCGVSPAYARLVRARRGRSARRPAGSASTGSSRTPPRGDEALRPRGWAGRTGRRRSAPRRIATRERRGPLRPVQLREARGRRARARAAFLDGSAPTTSTSRVGRRRLHAAAQPARRHRVRPHRDAPRRGPFLLVTGTAFGTHDLRLDRAHLPGDGCVHVARRDPARACFCLWGPRARDILQPLTRRPLERRLPVPDGARVSVGHVPVLAAARHLRRRAGLGALLPAEYGAALWDALWEAGRARPAGRRLPRHRRAAAGEGLPRLGQPTSRPRRRPYEAGLGFAVQLDKAGGFIGRDALAERGARSRGARLAASCSTSPRAVALGYEPVRVGGELAGRVTTGGYGYRVERVIAFAYLPAADAGRARG